MNNSSGHGLKTFRLSLGKRDSLLTSASNMMRFDLTQFPFAGNRGTKYSIALSRATFMNPIKTVTAYNKYLSIDINGTGVYTLFTLTEGYYTQTTFLAMLNSIVTFCTSTVNSATGYIRMYRVGPAWRYREVDNSAYAMMGLETFEELDSTHDGTSEFDISGPSTILIQTNLAQFNAHSSGKNILAEVPLTSGYGYMVNYEPTVLSFNPISDSMLSELHLSVFNSWTGEPVHIPNNSDFRLEFMIRID